MQNAYTVNQVVAYNVWRARQEKQREEGKDQWTLEKTAEKLAQYVSRGKKGRGNKGSKQNLSDIERSQTGQKARSFDADELLAFSLVFDRPISWFFVPPQQARRVGTDNTSLSTLAYVDRLFWRYGSVVDRIRNELGGGDEWEAQREVEKGWFLDELGDIEKVADTLVALAEQFSAAGQRTHRKLAAAYAASGSHRAKEEEER